MNSDSNADSAPAMEHIFNELRYYEDRARSEDEAREARLGTLAALSGAVLGLLTASIAGNDPGTPAVVLLLISAAAFVSAILVATQFVIGLAIPIVSRRLGGKLETIKEVDLKEFEYYLADEYQGANNADLQRRVLPIMRSAIGARRRNRSRKEQSLELATSLVAAGVLAAAAYGAILAI